jgi:hypothetical protein
MKKWFTTNSKSRQLFLYAKAPAGAFSYAESLRRHLPTQSLTGGVLRENAQVLRFDQDDNRSRQSKGDHGVTGSGIVKSTAGVCEDNILLAVLAEESHGDGIGSGLKLG